jgi:hypothetical protein
MTQKAGKRREKVASWQQATAVGIVAICAVVGAAAAAGSTLGAASNLPPNGALGIRSAGGLYSGQDAEEIGNASTVTRAVHGGSVANFNLEVVNTGLVKAQYQLNIVAPALGTTTLKVSGKDVSDLASYPLDETTGGRGYVTVPILPAKTAVFQLSYKPLKTATPKDVFETQVILSDIGGRQQFSSVTATTTITNAKGTSANDMFVSAQGQPFISGSTDFPPIPISATTVLIGKSTFFTLRLVNETPAKTANAITVEMVPQKTDPDCAGFSVVATIGKLNVTSALLGSGYTTAVLKSKQSVNIKVTVKSTTSANLSVCANEQIWETTASGAGTPQVADLIANSLS